MNTQLRLSYFNFSASTFTILWLLMGLLFVSVTEINAQTTVQAGIYKNVSQIELKFKPNADISKTSAINMIYTIKYPESFGRVSFNLFLNGAQDNPLFIQEQSNSSTIDYKNNGFWYRSFIVSNQNGLLNTGAFQANTEFTFLKFTVSGNSITPEDLELINDSYAQNTVGGPFWFSIDGAENTNTGSPFTQSKIPTTLPVELLSFNAKPTATATLLNWATASELNNKGFEVMRRLENEKEFKQIGFVNGKGTTTQISEYKFEDKHQATGTAYYMLRQIDFDLTSSNSPIVAVNYSKKNQLFVSLYPNPATDLVHLNVGPEVNTLFVNLYSAEGKLALTKEVKNGESLSVANLPQGLYQIIYTTETGEKGSGKLIIQK